MSDDFDFPVMVGLAPIDQKHVYCTDCSEQLPQRHECKTPRVNLNCPHVDCSRPDCDGKHEVSGPHASQPRGGFEFL